LPEKETGGSRNGDSGNRIKHKQNKALDRKAATEI